MVAKRKTKTKAKSKSKKKAKAKIDPANIQIGNVVRLIRTKAGLTTIELSKKVGISQAQVSRLENGHQGFRSVTILHLAEALKVPPFRFLMTDKEWDRYVAAK